MSHDCHLSYVLYQRHVHALTTNSRAYLKISRVSARDTRESVKFELNCIVHIAKAAKLVIIEVIITGL